MTGIVWKDTFKLILRRQTFWWRLNATYSAYSVGALRFSWM